MDLRPKLTGWLQDALAIEEAMIRILGRHLVAAAHYPQLAERLRQHLADTRRHAEQVHGCLKALGGSRSTLESAAARVMTALQTAADLLLADQVLTNTAAEAGLEHLEIATYCAIAAAADQAGERETAKTIREIMAEDQAMADWLAGHLPVLTRQYLT
ncbi:MAG: DUF892 family protein [Opitutaceae bacterium]